MSGELLYPDYIIGAGWAGCTLLTGGMLAFGIGWLVEHLRHRREAIAHERETRR